MPFFLVCLLCRKCVCKALRKKRTSILSTEDIEGEEHSVGEGCCLLLAGEVEAIDLPGVPPLVESWGGLVVLEALHYGVIDNHL